MVSVISPRHDDEYKSASIPPSPTHTHFDGASVNGAASEFDGTTMRSRSGSAHSRAKLISPQPPDDQDPKASSKKGKNVNGGDGEDQPDDKDSPRPALDLSADDALDAGPFAFKPFRLASLVDPKSLSSLEQMGGIEGLLRGLGTHAKQGLSAVAITEATDSKPGISAGEGEGAGQRHDRPQEDSGRPQSGETEEEVVPGIVVTGPGSEVDVTRKSNLADNQSDDEVGEKAYDASMDERRRVFGANVLPTRKTKSLLQLMWLALKDKVLVLLSIAAVVSLALGFFQDFGTPRPAGEPPVDWVEGVAIIVAILIVVLVGSVNDWQKERQFQTLNEKKEERGVKVIRAGNERVVDVHEVVVGDVAILEPGEIIPCDGVFLGGHNVRCDESGATGESDAIRKIDYEEALRARDGHSEHGSHADCFMVSGSKVLEGYGSYVVIAVGPKSFNGRIMMALRGDTEDTPLQLKLNDLAELIAKAGSIAGLALFVALMIRFFVQLGTNDPARTANQKGIAFVNILIISVTLIVVAVPEGLPLAVTLALAFATKRMTKENLLVRVLGSCETMANASVVCTDKTGTLTQNSMTIVAGTVGIHCKFVRNLSDNRSRTNAEGDQQTQDRQAEDVLQGARPTNGKRKHSQDFSIDQSEMNRFLHPALRELFNEAIAINSTAFEDTDPDTNELVFIGSKTEMALLKFAKELGWADYKKTREAADIVQMIPFSSSRKAMGVVVKLGDGRCRLYLKGASEILARKCTSYVTVTRGGDASESAGVETREIDDLARDNVSRTIIFYANQTLRAITLCYRDFESWPPAGASYTADDEVEYEDLARDLTLIAITGIEDPLREGVREAVADCFKAGVTVKMCTGDNVLTARSIALQCGIFSEGGLIMEGPVFRKLNDQELLEAVPRLQVLARSSPEDKKLLVEKLRELGEIVGVTGDGTNDGPALKTADVGFSMGIAGTEVAKEASDIILMDDNFASIVKAIMWGRCVNDAVRKFLQFQLSTNVTAVVVTFVSAVASASESSVLSAVQLLWINIIMDTFAALALATDPASPALLDRKPEGKTAPLFSVNMYKQIIGQSAYQILIVLLFHFLGAQILGFDPKYSSTVSQTTVFNIFVFAQITNSVNCRRLDNRLNIFEGITRNYYFMAVTLIEVAVQILIVFVGGAAFSVTRIGGAEWGISLALGLVSIPLGALIRCIPNEPVERLLKALHIMSNPAVLPTTRTDGDWNTAIELVRDNLNTFAHVRGGRMRASSYVDRSRKARPLPETELGLPSIMTMVPTLIASSIGRAPLSPNGLADPTQFDPSKSSAALWEGRIQVHPDTKPDDPTRQRWENEPSPC
ncbi:calcium-translocating P-type ATPase [Rhodofomes roseus]|uniref:Calcium-transporting ATPase n=1 Tax=Rhodofomes roseus TaxID=34475 RepID=A0ABQ8K4I2_9APHY|nr:calcium-translocating P-type ATPase [Rhodofomes roseus]KAH9831589.1 calcium-translocating P-type ATPase [Rhodofomes roseus]